MNGTRRPVYRAVGLGPVVCSAGTLGAAAALPSGGAKDPFYRATGAERMGETPSDAIPDRMLPVLRYILPDADEATRVDSS